LDLYEDRRDGVGALLAGGGGQVRSICVLDTPWDLHPALPSLRVLHLAPDCDPNHAPPTALNLLCCVQGRLSLTFGTAFFHLMT